MPLRIDHRRSFNYTHALSHSARTNAAQRILVPLMNSLQLTSILDVGCGLGTWLQVALQHGANKVAGIEGKWISPEKLLIDKALVHTQDLNNAFDLQRRFDLTISLEVAEHLQPDSADRFVQSLVRHSDIILFSAAVPGQGGNGHVNEQLQHYWAKRFCSHGYVAIDVVRPKIWMDAQVFWWLQQNTILYMHENKVNQFPQLRGQIVTRLEALSIIHPQLYFQWLKHAKTFG